MSAGKVILVSLLSLLVLIGVPALAIWDKYTTAYSNGVDFETSLEAVWGQNKSIKSNFEAKVKEILQVAKIANDVQVKIIESANKSRYGEQGSGATVQMLTEANPNVDISILKNLTQVIDAGREEFKAYQKLMLETKRQYTSSLEKKYFLGEGWWLKLAGFPTKNLDQYKVLVLENVQRQFETGTDQVLELK